MKNYKYNYRNHEIEVTYIPKTIKDETNEIWYEMSNLENEYGVVKTESYYSAIALQNGRIEFAAEGLTEQSAIINLYKNMAIADALNDIEKLD